MPKKKITINGLARMVQRGFLGVSKEMDKRFETVDRRFDAVDKRFEVVDRRFDALERKLDKVITQREERFVNLETEVKEIKGVLHIANF